MNWNQINDLKSIKNAVWISCYTDAIRVLFNYKKWSIFTVLGHETEVDARMLR